MNIKPSKNILILAFALFFMHVAKAQVSQSVFLQRSSLAFGVGFSKILGDSIYDQDLGKAVFGYYFNYPINESIDIDFGVLYNQRGGKSFNVGTLQTFGYIDAPIRINYLFSDGFKAGLGFQPSYNIYNYTIMRGQRSVLDPNPHPYAPKVIDYGVTASMDLRVSQNATLTFLGMYAFNSSTKIETPLNLGQVSIQLRVGIGHSVERVEELSYQSRKTEIDLVRLKQGYVVVCLSDRKTQAKYFSEKGDTLQARMILKDAKIKNASLREAFVDHYTYSKLVFIDVKDLANVCNGSKDAQIEDKNGNKVPISKIDNEFIVFFKPGSIYGNVSSFNKKGYEFVDRNCNSLNDPFPSDEFAAVGKNADMNLMVKELNKRLQSREASIRSKKYFSEDLLNQVY